MKDSSLKKDEREEIGREDISEMNTQTKKDRKM